MDIDIKKLVEKAGILMWSNKGLKILSVLLAIMCWYGIRSVIDSDRVLPNPFSFRSSDDPVEFEFVRPIRAVFAESSEAVRFSIEPETAVVRLSIDLPGGDAGLREAAMLYVDCSGATDSGSFRLPIRLSAPHGVNLIDISPADAIVELDFVD